MLRTTISAACRSRTPPCPPLPRALARSPRVAVSEASQKPLLAVTLGDPAGVGPEVVVARLGRSARPRVLPAGRAGPSRNPAAGRRARGLVGDGRSDRLGLDHLAIGPRPLGAGPHSLPAGRSRRRARRPAGQGRRPLRPGGLRSGRARHAAGARRAVRGARHGAAEQGGAPRRRAALPGPHRAAGRAVRRRRLRDDALPAQGRAARLARRAGRRPHDAALCAAHGAGAAHARR